MVDTSMIYLITIKSSNLVTDWTYKFIGLSLECYKYGGGFVVKEDYDKGKRYLRRMLYKANGDFEIVNQYKN